MRCLRISQFVKNRGKDAKLVIKSSQVSFVDSKTISLCVTNKVYLEYVFLGKELRVGYTQSNTTILTSVINIMSVLTTTCFGLICGPSSGCKIRLDKLYNNAWETLLGVGEECWGVTWSRFI